MSPSPSGQSWGHRDTVSGLSGSGLQRHWLDVEHFKPKYLRPSQPPASQAAHGAQVGLSPAWPGGLGRRIPARSHMEPCPARGARAVLGTMLRSRPTSRSTNAPWSCLTGHSPGTHGR